MEKVVVVDERTKAKQRSLANLKRFPKGVSGNPNGRPPGSGLSLTTEIKRKLAEVPNGSKASNIEMLIDKIFSMALKEKNEQIIKQIWAYVDGMPKQSTDLTTNGESIYQQLTDEQLNKIIRAKTEKLGITEIDGGEGKTD